MSHVKFIDIRSSRLLEMKGLIDKGLSNFTDTQSAHVVVYINFGALSLLHLLPAKNWRFLLPYFHLEDWMRNTFKEVQQYHSVTQVIVQTPPTVCQDKFNNSDYNTFLFPDPAKPTPLARCIKFVSKCTEPSNAGKRLRCGLAWMIKESSYMGGLIPQDYSESDMSNLCANSTLTTIGSTNLAERMSIATSNYNENAAFRVEVIDMAALTRGQCDSCIDGTRYDDKVIAAVVTSFLTAVKAVTIVD